MNPESSDSLVGDLFAQARNLPEQARQEFLDQYCPAEESSIRRQVEDLLTALNAAPNSDFANPLMPTGAVAKSTRTAPRLVGPYKLLQQLGAGGMGEVWMAEQREPVHRRVALKLIKAGQDSEEVFARFQAERQALAMMDHQNIAKVLDAGMTEDGRPFFAMELVQGIPFTEYCDKNRLTPQERLELFIPVCRAVQHAHNKGIIHRDIKPSNVLVTLYDGVPVPKVIDFGLAKALQFRLTEKTLFTEFGQVVGTVNYMSPEQAEMNAMDVDTRTDIYSLGVMLYELLTGSTPLEKETANQKAFLEILRSIRDEEPPRPSQRLSSTVNAVPGISKQRKTGPQRLVQMVRGDLDWIVMKALDKDRTRRYETAAAFVDELRRFLNDEPIEARPPSATYRLRKLAKKHRGAVAALSIVAVTLIGAVVVVSALYASAKRSADVARTAEDREATARQQAEAAQLRAEEARLLAEQRSSQLAQLIVKSFAEIQDWQLQEYVGRDPHPAELAVKMADSFVNAIDTVAASAKKPSLRLAAARAYFAAAKLRTWLGKPLDQELIRRSFSTLDQLVAEYPDNIEYFRELAHQHKDMVWLSRNEARPKKVLKHTQKAVDAFRRLTTLAPGFEQSKKLANVLNDLVFCETYFGLIADAKRHAAESISLGETLVAQDEEQTWVLSNALLLRSDVHRAANDFDAWRADIERAIRLSSAAYSEQCHPLTRLPTGTGESVAEMYYQLGDVQQAQKYLVPAVEKLNRKRKEDPEETWLGEAASLEVSQAKIDLAAEDITSARERLQRAIEFQTKGLAHSENGLHGRLYLARYQVLLGETLALAGEPALSRVHYQAARHLFEEVVEESFNDIVGVRDLIKFHVHCRDETLRDEDRAFALITQIVAKDGRSSQLAGMAQFHAGHYDEAVESFQQAMESRRGGDAVDWFYLAMIHARLGNAEEASMWYSKAMDGLDQPFNIHNLTHRAQINRLAEEAAVMLEAED